MSLSFPDLLKRYRERKKWSRADLARAIKVTPQYVAALESDIIGKRPSLETLSEIVIALDLVPSERHQLVDALLLPPEKEENSQLYNPDNILPLLENVVSAGLSVISKKDVEILLDVQQKFEGVLSRDLITTLLTERLRTS